MLARAMPGPDATWILNASPRGGMPGRRSLSPSKRLLSQAIDLPPLEEQILAGRAIGDAAQSR